PPGLRLARGGGAAAQLRDEVLRTAQPTRAITVLGDVTHRRTELLQQRVSSCCIHPYYHRAAGAMRRPNIPLLPPQGPCGGTPHRYSGTGRPNPAAVSYGKYRGTRDTVIPCRWRHVEAAPHAS